MKQNFGTKFYDALGAGPGGIEMHTTTLSAEQKHRLAMMKNVDDVKKEILKNREAAKPHVHFVQEEKHIKTYLRRKVVMWTLICLLSILTIGAIAILTHLVINNQPIVSENAALVSCIAIGIFFFIAYNKETNYRRQSIIMKDL